jgi:hypothetical protein
MRVVSTSPRPFGERDRVRGVDGRAMMIGLVNMKGSPFCLFSLQATLVLKLSEGSRAEAERVKP